MEKQLTTTFSIRLPIALKERINVLAHKRMCSVNAWIVRCLERETKPKGGDKNDG